jgi:hypothetical protein
MPLVTAIRNACEKVVNYSDSYFFHDSHKKWVMKILHVMEEYNSQKLTPRLQRLADDYSVEMFGSKRFAPWLYVYSAFRGEFKEGWIPDNFYVKIVCPRINSEALRHITDYKSFSDVVLKTEALPDIAYYIDGIFYNREFSMIGINALRERIFSSQKEVFIKKDNSGGGGVGVAKLMEGGFNEGVFQRIGNCVIQPPIKQHEFFDEIISNSVATVRITTAKDKNGKIDPRAAFLRLGRRDASWVLGKNEIDVAIANDSGELDCSGYDQDWRRWLSHPDSGFPFKNRHVPKFKEAIEVCIELHNKVPHFTLIGWDVTVDDSEKIKILEWNGDGCDIKFSEATVGPCFLGFGWEKLAFPHPNWAFQNT